MRSRGVFFGVKTSFFDTLSAPEGESRVNCSLDSFSKYGAIHIIGVLKQIRCKHMILI